MKKIIASLLIICCCFVLISCDNNRSEYQILSQQNRTALQEFIAKSVQDKTNHYKIVKEVNAVCVSNSFNSKYLMWFDRNGNQLTTEKNTYYQSRKIYFLEKDDSGEIAITEKVKSCIEFGTSTNGQQTYFTNRILNTTSFGLGGIDIPAVNGRTLTEYVSEPYLDNKYLPLVINATEFVSSRVTGKTETVLETSNGKEDAIKYDCVYTTFSFVDENNLIVVVYNANIYPLGPSSFYEELYNSYRE